MTNDFLQLLKSSFLQIYQIMQIHLIDVTVGGTAYSLSLWDAEISCAIACALLAVIFHPVSVGLRKGGERRDG